MNISENIIIWTKEELEKFRQEWYQKGVECGRFEERSARRQIKPGEIVECCSCGCPWFGKLK